MIEQYLYLWNNAPSTFSSCRPTLKKGVYIKIENELLPINNTDFLECYKVSGETLDKIDEIVEIILDYQLKILTTQKIISNSESSLSEYSLNYESPKKNYKFANQITQLFSKKNDYEQLKIQLEEMWRLYQEINKLIQFCERSKIMNNIEEINQKIITIKTKINEVNQAIEKINVSFQNDERKLNFYYFIGGALAGVVSSVIIQILL